MWSRLPGEILIPVAGKPTSSHVKPDFMVIEWQGEGVGGSAWGQTQAPALQCGAVCQHVLGMMNVRLK